MLVRGIEVELFNQIVAGLVGGLILNIMPCVLPVLAFKVQGWIHQADASHAERRKDALAFLAGALVTFAAFALVVIILRSSGQSIGWGMHMQNSGFVAFLVALLFIFGLNAIGVFELSFAMADGGTSQEGFWASFSHGALITLVSTPCSAPILGAATAAALAQDAAWYETLVLFWSIGVGLSLPVLAVGFIPRASALIPRPGSWMNTFKMLVGFTLFGAAIWLFGVLQKQLTIDASQNFLWFLLLLALGLWMQEQVRNSVREGLDRFIRRTIPLLSIVVAGIVFLDLEHPQRPDALPNDVNLVEVTRTQKGEPNTLRWVAYSDQVKAKAMKRGQPIFVDFTADWCASCKAFEKTHIETPSMIKVFSKTGILAVKADLTKSDDAMWDVLAQLGRNGLPAYVIYLPDGTHDLLPEGPPLSLKERLEAAGKRFPQVNFKEG